MSTRALTRSAAEAAAGDGRGYVALYCRISRDKSGRVEGVKTQERWGRAYAARTWPDLPVRAFADNDLSAADEDVVRPAYEELRAAIRRGEPAQLWTVEQSRLERREAHWFVLAAQLEAAGIDQMHTNRDGVVSVRSEVAGIKAVLAAAEVRQMKKRINDTLRAKAEQGEPAGTRPFGYRHGRLPNGIKTYVVVEEEAAALRECADRVLSGWSLTLIASDLVGRGFHGAHRVKLRDASGEMMTEDGRPVFEGGVPLTRPGKLTSSSVRQWVTNAAVAGLRVYRGEIIGPGNWPAILDEQTWRAVRHRLAGARTVRCRDGSAYPVSGRQHQTGRRYLLTGGVAVCGVCGAPLVAQVQKWPQRDYKVALYMCSSLRGGRGCITILAEPFEQHVVNTLLDALDRDEFWAAFSTDEHAERRAKLGAALDDVDLQRAELAKEWAVRTLTMVEWREAREGLTTHERTLRVELASVPPPVVAVDRAAIRAGWGAMNLGERREIISMFIETVAVGKARRGANKFDPARVAPPETWWRMA